MERKQRKSFPQIVRENRTPPKLSARNVASDTNPYQAPQHLKSPGQTPGRFRHMKRTAKPHAPIKVRDVPSNEQDRAMTSTTIYGKRNHGTSPGMNADRIDL